MPAGRVPRSRKLLAAIGLILSAVAGRAWGSSDTFGLGDGHLGPLLVTAPGSVVNTYAQLAADAGAGSTQLVVAPGGTLSPGDLAMLYQAQDNLSWDAGAPDAGTAFLNAHQSPLVLAGTGVGDWELARIASASGGTVTLTAPLVGAFAGGLTQVVRVPEYTSVIVADGGSIVAAPWDGGTGGIVAFLATQGVTVQGPVSAAGAGFRGGPLIAYATCISDEFVLEGGFNGAKGEGVIAGRYGTGSLARGNVANAGGAGNDCNGGGGGGGNGGLGGQGGWDAPAPPPQDVGGVGGAPLSFSPLTRLTFGGGGGAGHENDGCGGAGGPGGGIVFVRGAALQGQGTIGADGAPGMDAGCSKSDGAGGGGAGGTVYLRFTGAARCGGVTANGGNGGNTPELTATGGPVGPGGGGAGGVLLLQASDVSQCPASVYSGLAGTQPDPTYPPFYGAEPDAGSLASSVGLTQVVPSGYLASDAGVDGGAGGGQGLLPLSLAIGCTCASAPAGSVVALVLLLCAAALRHGRRRLSSG